MSDHDQPVAANLLERRFKADAPNQRSVGDTTEFVIASSGTGKLHLAAILDLFSRFIVGWAVSVVNDRHLTISAWRRRSRAGAQRSACSITPKGSTYASEDYQDLLAARGIVCSMSRRGNCHDNAVMDSCFSTIKTELVDRFDSCSEARRELFDYIEVFYNQRRRHSTIGQISPARAWRGHGRHGKPHRTRFPTAPTPIAFLWERGITTDANSVVTCPPNRIKVRIFHKAARAIDARHT
jgi:transposase InsO family protein